MSSFFGSSYCNRGCQCVSLWMCRCVCNEPCCTARAQHKLPRMHKVITNHIDLRYQPQKDGSLICKTGCDNALGVVTARSIRVCWVLSASTRLKTTTRCFPNALLQRSATQHPRMVSTRALIPV